MGAKATEPWTGWEPTVEADPVDSDELQRARARAKVLLDAVDAHYVAEQKTAGDWNNALLRRNLEARRLLASVSFGKPLLANPEYWWHYEVILRVLALLDEPLEVKRP